MKKAGELSEILSIGPDNVIILVSKIRSATELTEIELIQSFLFANVNNKSNPNYHISEESFLLFYGETYDWLRKYFRDKSSEKLHIENERYLATLGKRLSKCNLTAPKKAEQIQSYIDLTNQFYHSHVIHFKKQLKT